MNIIDIRNISLIGFVQPILINPFSDICYFQEADMPKVERPFVLLKCELVFGPSEQNTLNPTTAQGYWPDAILMANYEYCVIIDWYDADTKTGRIIKHKLGNVIINKVHEFLGNIFK